MLLPFLLALAWDAEGAAPVREYAWGVRRCGRGVPDTDHLKGPRLCQACVRPSTPTTV